MSLVFLKDGTLLDDSSELALIDAVLPDIVATKHSLLQNSRPIKPDFGIKQESNLDDGHFSHELNYKSHGEVMDLDGAANDVGNHRATILTGHESEVGVDESAMIFHDCIGKILVANRES